MEQANLPSQTDLNSLYGAWNPMSYMQGFQNQGIADQFRQQGFQGNQQALEANQMKNSQSALMNPLLVAEQQGKNTNLGYKNTLGGMEVERATANQGAVLSEDLRAHALKMTDDEFKQADQHIESLLRSQDPKEQAMGIKLQSTLPSMLAEKRKSDQAMALQKEQTRSHLAGIGAQTASNKELEQMRIEAGKYDKNAKGASGAKGIMDAVSTGKMTYEKAATAFHAVAQFEPDPEIAAKYEDLAAQYEQMDKNKPIAGKEGSINTAAATGMAAVTTPRVIQPKAATAMQTPQDKAAYEWATANPNDPRAAKILQKLGH